MIRPNRTDAVGRPLHRGRPAALVCRLAGLSVAALLVAGCAPATESSESSAQAPQPQVSGAPSAVAAPPAPIPDARVGKDAASTRIRFIPSQLVLSSGAKAAVETASTVNGELAVPTDVRHLGWWDGGAQAGDPFGAIVVAGHVDSKTQGLGFFSRLLQVRKGQRVVLKGEGHQLSYTITRISTVKKGALAADNAAFGQDGDHRLVLITCAGAYRPGQGGYDSNLVVIAKPNGLAR